MDSSGNLYIAGGSWYAGSQPGLAGADGILVRYSSTGVPQWTARYSQPDGQLVFVNLVVDAAGNTYVTGGGGED